MKSLFILFSTLGLFSFSLTSDQKSNEDYLKAILAQLHEHPGQMLGFSASNVYHVYEIDIPADAEVTENANMFIVNPVNITIAASTTVYDITKQTIPYKMTIFKEYKGTHAMGRKDVGNIITIWQKKESTKEFSATLKELKNLANTPFDDLYGAEDDFPQEWKSE